MHNHVDRMHPQAAPLSEVPVAAETAVAFARHPAAIELHSAASPLERQCPGMHAFEEITTWSPCTFEEPVLVEAVPDAVWAAEEPALVERPWSIEPALAEAPADAYAAEPITFESERFVEADAPEPPFTSRLAETWQLSDEAETERPESSVGRRQRDILWPGIPPQLRPIEDPRALQDGSWVSEPSLADQMLADEMLADEMLANGAREVPPRRRMPRWDALLQRQSMVALLAAAVLFGLVLAGIWLTPSLLGSGSGVEALVNAPMMVVRAAVTGRVMTVAATPGQVVDPRSPLLTIHVNDSDGPNKAVLAGVHGLVRSVETVPGADLATGAPLVRLQDCDRAFLTIPTRTQLRAGETVRVMLPDGPELTGTVRASSGIMEPPDTLVIGLPPGALADKCPVGASATVRLVGKPPPAEGPRVSLQAPRGT